MSITSRLFICEEADIDRLRSGACGGRDFEGTPSMKSVTSLHLHMIWAAIDGIEWDPDVHTGVPLTENDPWIEHLPSAMVDAFASVGDDLARRIADSIAPSEDFGWGPGEVFALIAGVREFAARARGAVVCIETSL